MHIKIITFILLIFTLGCGETKPVVVKQPKVEKLQKNEIKLSRKNSSVFEVVVELNGALKVPMIMDSGCSDVSLPPYIIYTLIKIGTIKQTDFLSSANYTIADGTSIPHERVIIRELKIGNYTLKNIECSVGTSELSPILLGQSVLNKFKRVTVDYKKEVLILEK